MATQYTSLLGLALPVTGELSGTWGDTVNDSITSLLDTAVAGTTSLTTDTDVTLTTTTGASNQARQAIILWAPASGTTTRNITAPAQSKIYTVINASGGTQSIVFRGAGPTTGVTIVKGEAAIVAWNGSDFIKVSNTGGSASFTNVTVTGTTTLSALTASTALALDSSKNVVSVTNTGTGNNVLSASPTLTGTVAGASLQLSSLTATRVTYAGASGLLTDSANMTFNGTRLTVADLADSGLTSGRVTYASTGGALVDSANLTFDGTTLVASNLTDSSLTSGRVTYATTGGNLTDSANLTFNGTDLTVSGAVNAGTINATTLDLTNIEVTNIKAKDGTASITLADSTGVASFTANPVLSGGTANGVAYLNGSKVLTTGSALTFDGAALRVSGSIGTGGALFTNNEGGIFLNGFASYGSGLFSDATGQQIRFQAGGSEQMRLTSTGLGIGTSSVTSGYKLEAQNGASGTGIRASNSGGGYIAIEAESNASSNGVLRWTNDLKFIQGTSEQMRLTSTGLGIGTSSPASRLDVSASGADSVLSQTVSGVQRWQQIVQSSTGNWLLYDQTGAATRMTMSTSGNLGLGVTPSAWVSSVKALDVGSSGASYYSGGITHNAYFDGADSRWEYKNASSTPATFLNIQGGTFAFNIAGSGTAGNAISFTQAMTLDASGNLAIGATSATGRLTVRSDSTTAQPFIDIVNRAISSTFVQGGIRFSAYRDVADPSYVSAIWTVADAPLGNSGNLVFGTSINATSALPTERARIDSSGNLLVGKTVTTLSTVGSYVTSAGEAGFTRDGAESLNLNRLSSDGQTLRFFRQTSQVGNISVTTSATSYNTSSDYRLKEDIQPMTGALAFVRKQRPVKYRWKADGSEGSGYIAHWMQEDGAGQCVTGEKDAVDADGKPVYQGIDTSFMVGPLNAAINELADIVDAQAAIITALTARVAALESN